MVLIGGIYITNVTSSYWIDPFIIVQCPSLSLFTFLVLKSVLYDVSVAPVLLFHFYLHGIFIPPLHFHMYGSLRSEVSLLCAVYRKVFFFFLIHLANLSFH